jgi:hypothetical protein
MIEAQRSVSAITGDVDYISSSIRDYCPTT